MDEHDKRPGEVSLPFDPGAAKGDARVVFIGRIRSPWTSRKECPKNLREARERGLGAAIEIDAPWRQGLRGLSAGAGIIVLYWMHGARRDLIVQVPSCSEKPSGVFALRSPIRPNPIAVAVVRCLSLDLEQGSIEIDAIDALDGTPVLDLKPWFSSTDVPPGD